MKPSEKFDLYKYFSEVNRNVFKKVFDYELPPIQLKWISSKNKLGVTRAYINDQEVKYIGISDFYDITEEEFLSTLIHEMLHAMMVLKGELTRGSNYHGRDYVKYVKQVNSRTKYETSAKHDAVLDGLKLSDDTPLKKKVTVFIVKNFKGHGKHLMTIFKGALKGQDLAYIMLKFESWSQASGKEFEVYHSRNYKLKQFRIKRKQTSRLTGSLISNDLYSIIAEKNSEMKYQVELGNGMEDLMKTIKANEVVNVIRHEVRKELREMSKLDRAMDLAMQAHMKQKRRSSGKPYIVHPKRVATRARQLGYNKTIQIAAMLHDVIEDAPDPKRYAELIKNYFGGKILDIVKALSHGKNKPYNKYIVSLWKRNPDAFKVKMVDMIDNLIDNPSPSQIEKYREAIEFLMDSGAEVPERVRSLLNI